MPHMGILDFDARHTQPGSFIIHGTKSRLSYGIMHRACHDGLARGNELLHYERRNPFASRPRSLFIRSSSLLGSYVFKQRAGWWELEDTPYTTPWSLLFL